MGSKQVFPMIMRRDQRLQLEVTVEADGHVAYALVETMPPAINMDRLMMPTQAEEREVRTSEWAALEARRYDVLRGDPASPIGAGRGRNQP
jgi:hypothetical protein